MFQCRKRQRGCANTNLDGKRFVALGKHGIHCRRPPKLKMQNGDDDTKKMQNAKWWWWYKDLEFICCISHIIVVNTTFSGWMYICFIIQHTCKSSFHVACNHLFPNLLPWSYLRHSDRRQTPNPGTCWAAIWWSTSSPQGSLPLLILGYPNLPISIDFIKENEKTGPTW